jgi:hypothetical protein
LKAGRRLADLKAAYKEVVGREPGPRLLTSVNSSYMRNTPATFKAKLQQLADG